MVRCAVKLSVTFCNDALTWAAVRSAPTWLERYLLGEEETDRMIVGVVSCDGALIWIEDGSGRIVDDMRLVGAIEASRAEAMRAVARGGAA